MHRILAFLAVVFARPAIAVNAVLTPNETSRGTQTLAPDAAITFKNAVVKKGSDDRHFNVTSLQTDVPRGVLLNDEVGSDELGVINKSIAVFGVYPETIPCVASAAIAADAEVVIDPANPGKVMTKPATVGQTYIVIGRSRFTVANAGDPVSLIHCVPRVVVQ